jgi:hypothetical protein
MTAKIHPRSMPGESPQKQVVSRKRRAKQPCLLGRKESHDRQPVHVSSIENGEVLKKFPSELLANGLEPATQTRSPSAP